MESQTNGSIPSNAATGRSRDFSDSALGMISTQSFPAIVGTADMMLKSASVTLVGYEKIGNGYCTAVVRGGLSDVRIAVEVGAQTAEQFGQLVSKSVIPRPLGNLDAVLPIGSRLAALVENRGYSRLSNLAIGLLETRGFPAMVGAADAMLKAADVQLAAYETIGDGLCTAIIRGYVSDVTMAIEAGMHEAERIGELHAIMVIPRPLDDLEDTLPVASCWLDQPLSLPLSIKETQTELVEVQTEMPQIAASSVELPDLQQLSAPPEQSIAQPLAQPLERPLGQPLEQPLGQPLEQPLGQHLELEPRLAQPLESLEQDQRRSPSLPLEPPASPQASSQTSPQASPQAPHKTPRKLPKKATKKLPDSEL